MNAKIDDIMVPDVITVTPHTTVQHVMETMRDKNISALPVVDTYGAALGIVTSSDLLDNPKPGAPVSQIMSDGIYTVPRYEGVHIAARIMRNHKLHHVVVTHEKKVVGIVSAFDLLKLVEDKRFVMKNAPTSSDRKGGKRKKGELSAN
ncbi:MAG: CBS domain-containing protein [Planctomycetota bacterium]|jgi:CBS domain-containing protein